MIEGTVFDTLSGRPIPFAVVSIANTEFTTLASRRGRYRVLVDDRETQLEFRKLGYRMKAVTVRPDDDVITRDVYLRPIPNAMATPQAARLNLGSGSRAIMAARNGPSAAIMSHVAARGAQKKKIDLLVRRSADSW